MAEALVPTHVLHPGTGEVLELARPTKDLASFLDEARDFESRLREAKGLITNEILRRMDSNASWTERAGNFQLSSSSPEPKTEWDAEKLKDILFELLAEGVISTAAADAALETVTTYKPKPKGINALMKLGTGIKERVLVAKLEVEKRRYVRVEKA